MPQKPRSQRESYDIVVKDDLRPAGDGKHCFYCGIALHGRHRQDCVIRLGAGWYHAHVRKNATGEVRAYRFDMEWQEPDDHSSGSIYGWKEGNFSCDCNRELFFLRADDEDEPDEPECGETRFSVLFIELPDGRRIPIDDSPPR